MFALIYYHMRCTLLAIGIMNVVAQIQCLLYDGMLNLLADASWIQLITMHGQWTKKYFAFYCSLQKTSLICIVRAMFCVKKLHRLKIEKNNAQ